MQIATTTRYHFAPAGPAIILLKKKEKNEIGDDEGTDVGQRCGKRRGGRSDVTT